MSHVRDGVGPSASPRAVSRSVVLLAAGLLAVPLLTACSEEDQAGRSLAGPDVAPASRGRIADGGTLRWAVDAAPETFNTFQADADATTSRVAQAVLPSLYRMDANGRPERNADYLESARLVEREPKQVVVYKLHQQAVWSDGREIGAADFAAQWRALSGKDSAYWTARNAGYDRIQKVERGASDLEVRVTFGRPYADWKSLFSPLYPKQVTGTPDAFNDGVRRKLKVTAGPFALQGVDREHGEVTLVRNPRWWGRVAKLQRLVLRAVPREERMKALLGGEVDLAEIGPEEARRVAVAAGGGAGRGKETGRDKETGKGTEPGASAGDDKAVLQGTRGTRAELTPAAALRSWAVAHGSDKQAAVREARLREKRRKALVRYARQQSALRGFAVRKSLEPAHTQLALNGAEGPLADERVRRAVARSLDRKELASLVLKPLGLPAEPVGSHLALAGQAAYADNSGALGGENAKEARSLLADAGWARGGPVEEENGKKSEERNEENNEKKAAEGTGESGDTGDTGDTGGTAGSEGDDGTYIVGEDDKPGVGEGGERETSRWTADDESAWHLAGDGRRFPREHAQQGGVPGAYAPKGTAAPAGAPDDRPLVKKGKALSLRFVLPSGPGSGTLRTVGERISRMLARVGIGTRIVKVPDDSYFKDHVANGQYDLALYSWPASAYPATDARPIHAKPVPAADGSLNVEQNYTRVGTDQVDQLFDQAVTTLDEEEAVSLVRKADARIWAAAGSIPLYQRPQLMAARVGLANAGAFGLRTPVYEDMGFLKKAAKSSPGG
ncbi:ABC transporter family substrate-binding protein [Streptomyces poonensis]|uniref:Lipoprotein n=1 Tax=Streptomyces poonensis TaxID=68255 RepID=A0A918P8D4_9ACTN|nr:ABC transporter family substrate-binding protein [Streptomyces poonensis]GGY90114.1 lipoprotein [Streptomyces poonensis]GLJ88002.1 lipoprotein [Streptomyces poonensis]